MQSLLILGRQPDLGLAELESLYGADKLIPLNKHAVIVDIDPCLLAFDRLGGSIKFCKVLTELNTNNWPEIETFLCKVSPEQSKQMPAGKMQLGLSLYGFNLSPSAIIASGLKLKKAIQKTGRSVRFTPNKTTELNSAQVIHNKLTGPNGWELILVNNGQKTVVAQSVKVQDIKAYAKRDQSRPNRDSKVGMLPPKLAQIIINLAVGQIPEDKLASICDIPADQNVPPPYLGQKILDPFCGTGVISQEALLMGYDTVATDIEARLKNYSEANLKWLREHFLLGEATATFNIGDATNFNWNANFDYVASEVYLGQPYNHLPDAENLNRNIANCNLIIKKFLKNIAPQLKSGSRLCLAIPAWQVKPAEFKFLPLIDQIEQMGYNLIKLRHVSSDRLLYYRESQIVARELLIITRK